MLPISLLFYCCLRPFFELTASILKVTTGLMCRYPSVFFLIFIQAILQVAIAVGIGVTALFIAELGYNKWIYLYVVFTFFWISYTLSYVVYLTLSGLGASWYFLTGTEYESKHPVWDSFKRAMSTSFGSAAVAAFTIAVIEVLRFLAKSGGGKDQGAMAILRCLALCILAILEACVKWINRYALIYCAVFGVPFKEGCRRWAELSVKKFVDVIVTGCIINRILGLNLLVFTLAAGFGSFGIGALAFEDNGTDHAFAILMLIAAVMLTLAIFIVLEQPIRAISDTLLVCFVEAPDRLQSSASELAHIMIGYYQEELGKRVASQS
jgi:hypothetical protein